MSAALTFRVWTNDSSPCVTAFPERRFSILDEMSVARTWTPLRARASVSSPVAEPEVKPIILNDRIVVIRERIERQTYQAGVVVGDLAGGLKRKARHGSAEPLCHLGRAEPRGEALTNRGHLGAIRPQARLADELLAEDPPPGRHGRRQQLVDPSRPEVSRSEQIQPTVSPNVTKGHLRPAAAIENVELEDSGGRGVCGLRSGQRGRRHGKDVRRLLQR